MDAEGWSTSVTFTQSPENGAKMKAIFKRSGLQIPADSGVPESFFWGLPMQEIYQIVPEPAGAADLTAIANAIFRDFCGLEPDSEVLVSLLELNNAT
jgi:hypothetical protein